jgi:hypothetical protein
MKLQTLSDLEELERFDSKGGVGYNLPRYPQRRTGKTKCETADQWLDSYAGWCEPFKARMSKDTCKSRKNAELSDFCKGCEGIRKQEET